MLGYIALCPHFHQPHFQLARTSEEVFQASYAPWLDLLEKATARWPAFFISLHLSGPWLYWLGREKPFLRKRLNRLAGLPGIGITGGLADESFPQLSSRTDDFYFQMREYDRLCQGATGVGCSEWQAVHIVEREAGELVLREMSRAARLCGAEPVFLLDAETFYQSSYTLPGAADDLGQFHYGIADPYSRTVCAHLPPELMMYPLRDEIGGQVFFVLPVHSQFRYQLLKRNAAAAGDRLRIEPRQYLFYVKDRLEQAAAAAAGRLNRNQPPVAAIFEDAEKLGQWSGDPRGDAEWLWEFFARADADPEVAFTGPGRYLQQHGFLDTYPVSSSRSYPEWEKWTAHRGIRGLNLADDRLRKTVARLRDAETILDRWENQVWERAARQSPGFIPASTGDQAWEDRVRRAVFNSAERFAVLEGLMNPPEKQLYSLVNRVRHLVYQEDPKWASRHPGYGAAPHYDARGLACLECALTLLGRQAPELTGLEITETGVVCRDWDGDGCPEWILTLPGQLAVITSSGGCVAYYHRVDPALADDPERLRAILQKELLQPGSGEEISGHAGPLVLTETDSELCTWFYPEGGRVDRCRNSMRCELIGGGGAEPEKAGFHQCRYDYESSRSDGTNAVLTISARREVSFGGFPSFPAVIMKTFTLDRSGLAVHAEIICEMESGSSGRSQDWQAPPLRLVLEAVTSAVPSDEINFSPCSYLEIHTVPGPRTALRLEREESVPGAINSVHYVFRVSGVRGETRDGIITFDFERGSLPEGIAIKPAVRTYLAGLVFPEQSCLGYARSGIMLELTRSLQAGRAGLGVVMNRAFAPGGQDHGFTVPLLGSNPDTARPAKE